MFKKKNKKEQTNVDMNFMIVWLDYARVTQIGIKVLRVCFYGYAGIGHPFYAKLVGSHAISIAVKLSCVWICH